MRGISDSSRDTSPFPEDRDARPRVWNVRIHFALDDSASTQLSQPPQQIGKRDLVVDTNVKAMNIVNAYAPDH